MTERVSDHGFSLVEVLIVLVIMALATSVVVMQVRPPQVETELTLAERIMAARAVAARSGSPQVVGASTGEPADQVIVFPDGSLSRLVTGTSSGYDGRPIGVSRRSFAAMELQR